MDISEIRKLIKLVHGSDVTELEIAEGETAIRISRQGAVATYAPIPQAVAPAPAAPASVTSTAPAAEDTPNDEHVVKSPMVGTFYASSSPNSPAFVSEGSKVKKGDVLCIVEAMKLMNEIEAEYAGTVSKILATNAQPLEYGQPLFVIIPA